MPSACNPTRWFGNTFSQTAQVRERKAKGLHPVNEMQRFYMLVCCFFCSTTVSVTYAFDMFTPQLQNQFGISDGDLTTVSTVGLVFCYLTLPFSFIYEACGPFLLFWVCFVCGGLGALLMALAFDGKVTGNTATFSVYYAMLNLTSGVIDAAYITTLAEMFPRNRGPVIALAKVMSSLGSSALSVICVDLFESNIISYIYFLMALCMVTTSWAAVTVTLPPYYMNWWRRRGKTEEEIAELEALKPYYERKFVPKPRLIIGYVVVIAMVIFYAVQAPVMAYSDNVTKGSRIAVGVVAIVLVLCIFLMLTPLPALGGMNEPAPIHAPNTLTLSLVEPVNSDGYLSEEAPAAAMEALEDQGAPTRQDPRYQGTVLSYLTRPDLWMLLISTFLCSALGMVVSYNSSTISIAINGYARSTELSALYTAFLGVGSAVGRIGVGLFEAYVQHQKPGHRRVILTMGLFVCPVVTTVAGILLLTIPGEVILLPFIMLYFQNGWSFALNAIIFPSLFEGSHSIIYNMNFLSTMISIICFNRLLFGFYTDKKHDDLGFPKGQPCRKPECVRVPLIVTTCTAFVSLFAVAIVHFRYSRFLKRHYNSLDAEESRLADAKDPLNASSQGLEDVPAEAAASKASA